LFDHNVPHKLRPSLPDHEVSTAEAMGWAVLENGELLQAAEDAGFELMVTCDQNLSYQQNLQGRKLALVVLSTNNWNLLKRDLPPVITAVNNAQPGSFQFIKIRSNRQ
jgi:hypothetical protein